jgi:hypothetical protein
MTYMTVSQIIHYRTTKSCARRSVLLLDGRHGTTETVLLARNKKCHGESWHIAPVSSTIPVSAIQLEEYLKIFLCVHALQFAHRQRIRLRWKSIKMRRFTILKGQMQEFQVSSGTGLLDLEHSTRCRQLRSDFDTSAKRQERPHTRTQQSMQNRQNSSRMEEESEQEQDANALHQQLPSSLV